MKKVMLGTPDAWSMSQHIILEIVGFVDSLSESSNYKNTLVPCEILFLTLITIWVDVSFPLTSQTTTHVTNPFAKKKI